MSPHKKPQYKMFIVPAVAGLLAWGLSGNIALGGTLFLATLAGNWVMKKEKRN